MFLNEIGLINTADYCGRFYPFRDPSINSNSSSGTTAIRSRRPQGAQIGRQTARSDLTGVVTVSCMHAQRHRAEQIASDWTKRNEK